MTYPHKFDTGADGEEASTPIDGLNLGINAGASLCIINKVYAPSNVAVMETYQVDIDAEFTYSGSTLAGGASNTETVALDSSVVVWLVCKHLAL